MKKLITARILRCILVVIVGSLAIHRLITQADHNVIFDEIINFFLGAVVLVLYAWIIYKDRKEYKTARAFTSYLSACMIGVITALTLAHRDSSPSILFAVNDGGYNGANIDLRKDGPYKVGNFCLGYDYFRGKYTMKDSIIMLDTSDIGGVIESNRLVIRTSNYDRNAKEIYQVDAQDSVLSEALIFSIINNQESK
jgi:hypothetical protein